MYIHIFDLHLHLIILCYAWVNCCAQPTHMIHMNVQMNVQFYANKMIYYYGELLGKKLSTKIPINISTVPTP